MLVRYVHTYVPSTLISFDSIKQSKSEVLDRGLSCSTRNLFKSCFRYNMEIAFAQLRLWGLILDQL